MNNPDTIKIKQVVLQSTSLCNINCSYCYLSEVSRSTNNRMELDTAVRALTVLAQSQRLAKEVDIRWHAGEPLIVPPAFYSEAIKEIRRVVPARINLTHSVQTNATLTNKEWCELFLREGIRVGVSIDGPKFLHDRYRLTKLGKGTHDKVMQGIATLCEYKVPFEVIAVVTSETLEVPDQFFRFFEELKPTIVALNIEESECGYDSNLLNKNNFTLRYKTFLSRIYQLQKESALKFREFEEIQHVIKFNRGDRNSLQAQAFSIVTIDWTGNLYTFSPELAGTVHPDYSTFAVGNVMKQSIDEMLCSKVLKKISSDIASGVELCRNNCDYFSLCGGGAPSNKLYENGSFISTDTGYCWARIQLPTDIVLADLETKLMNEQYS